MTEFERLESRHNDALEATAFLCIHSTRLGPALGGIRLLSYQDDEAARGDAMRLAEAMTYKASLAGLDLGGGKMTVNVDPASLDAGKRKQLFEWLGEFIHEFRGDYIATEDMNVSPQDLVHVKAKTPHVVGLPASQGGSGDPSPVTARGVYRSIKACLLNVYGNEVFRGKKFLVQGVGNVGSKLAKELTYWGGSVLVADIDAAKAEKIAKECNAETVSAGAAFDAEVDVFCPCAVGGLLTAETANRLKARIVCGAANNALSDDAVARRLAERNILYAPDFLVNAGGLICVSSELPVSGKKFNAQEVGWRADVIYDRVAEVLHEARASKRLPLEVAYALARERLKWKTATTARSGNA